MVANAKKDGLSLTPMLNAYPDSLGGTLRDIADLLESSCKDAFGAFYILPSVFNTDLDRGFSVVDYSLNELLATPQDLERIRAFGNTAETRFYPEPRLGPVTAVSRSF